MIAERRDQVDNLHGELVADPYRWLEDTDAAETRGWVAAQNVVTERWLGAVPVREEIRAELSGLWDFPRRGAPFGRWSRWFQWRNTGLQNQDVLFVMSSPEDQGRVLLDPNALSADGTSSVTTSTVTDDGAMLAYAISEAGSDWMTWRVRDVASGADLPDVVPWAKYASGAWLRDGSGFLYGRVDPPADGDALLEASTLQRILLHRLGSSPDDDELIFAAPDEPDWIADPQVSHDGRFLIINVGRGTAREARIFVRDQDDPDAGLRSLVGEFALTASYLANDGTTFFLLTDDGAERGRVVSVDLDDPARERWQEIVPERADLLLEVAAAPGRFVCHYLHDACARLVVLDRSGREVDAIPCGDYVSLAVGAGETSLEAIPDSPLVHFVTVSFDDAGTVWEHDLDAGATRVIGRSAAHVASGEFVTEQVFVAADDGVRVPLFLTRLAGGASAGVTPIGDAPVLLYGYGGFRVPITPRFHVAWAAFVKRGGVLAVASLRGGGEYGRSWHRAGMLSRKQRVFDDFCDCARWLAGPGGSRPERIAISGGSNGGLLVGACMIQHPELFGAAVAEVGVLDMLRFHLFTIGWAWKSDYGDPNDPGDFRVLRAYSPLHNVESGRAYPPLLLSTGDHDDRVIPGHSFKFAATMQHAAGDAAGSTVLVRTEVDAGHGHGLPTVKAIAIETDILTFLAGTVGAMPRAAISD